MSRDFDGEFDEMMVAEAARDSDLVEHFRFQMFGPGDDNPQIRGTILESDIKYHYVLNEELFSKSVGICISKLAGVKTGRELFGE